MQVMQIDINDSDITGHGKKEEEQTVQSSSSSSTMKTVTETKPVAAPMKTEPAAKPKGFGNLFGTATTKK